MSSRSSARATALARLAALALLATALPAAAPTRATGAELPGPVAPRAPAVESSATPVLDVATGSVHTCAIREDGTVACWGDDYSGQSSPPDGIFIAIDADADTTCGVRADGSLSCWGDGYGRSTLPAGPFVDLSVGPYHACAIRPDGTIACWGASDEGQALPPGGTYVVVSAGVWHTCALRADGRLVCWGGLPDEEVPPVPTNDTFVALDGTCAIRSDGQLLCWDGYGGTWWSPMEGSYRAVSGTCAIRTDGTLACWGDQDDPGMASPPSGAFKVLSENNSHACAIGSDGTLACWGRDDMGQGAPRPTPRVATEAWRTAPSATVTWGARHALAPVTTYDVRYRRARWDGTFSSWTTLYSGTTETAAEVRTSPGYTYCFAARARDASGAVSFWTNQAWYGGETGCTATPLDDRSLTRSAAWVAATGSEYYGSTSLGTTAPGAMLTAADIKVHWVALLATMCPTCGTVKVSWRTKWGELTSRRVSLYAPTRIDQKLIPLVEHYNDYEATLGTLTITVVSSGRPVIVDGLMATRLDAAPGWADADDPPAPGAASSSHAVLTVSAGGPQTCAIKPDGTLHCWGTNTFEEATTPEGTFTAVSAGGSSTAWHDAYSCAIRTDGTLACWGNDSPWAWEDPIVPPPGTFTALSAGSSDLMCAIRTDGTLACTSPWSGEDESPAGTFLEVSAGDMFACGIRTDGTLACWGANGSGEASPPDGIFDAVGAGADHACAIRTDGTLACWGGDEDGKASPPAGTFSAVGAGAHHTCAIRSDGELVCWGGNEYGEATPPPGTFVALESGEHHACAVRADRTFACWGQNRSRQVSPRPTAMITPLRAVHTSPGVGLTWRATSLAPVVSYDVRYREARWDGRLGSWQTWRSGLAGTGATFAGQPGHGYCFAVRAHDAAGTTSLWSTETCTLIPLDERQLRRSAGWTIGIGPAYYRGTYVRSTRKGATLTRSGIPMPVGITLIATTCPTCGVVKVFWGPYRLARVSLYSPTRVDRSLIRVIEFDDDEGGYRPADLTIKVVSKGKPVIIDGIIVDSWWIEAGF